MMNNVCKWLPGLLSLCFLAACTTAGPTPASLPPSVLEADASQIVALGFERTDCFGSSVSYLTWAPGQRDLLADGFQISHIYMCDPTTDQEEYFFELDDILAGAREEHYARYGQFLQWSEDGSRIVAEVQRCMDPPPCFDMHFLPMMIDTATGQARVLPTPNDDSAEVVAASPDGLTAIIRIWDEAAHEYSHYFLDTDTGALTNLALDGLPEGSSFARVLAWSPDGEWLAVAFDAPVALPGNRGQDNIYLMHPDGSDATVILTGAARIESIAFSPDSSKIAWVEEGGIYGVIYVANRDGSGAHELLVAAQVEPSIAIQSNLAWSPDGTRLAFVASHRMAVLTLGVEEVPPATP